MAASNSNVKESQNATRTGGFVEEESWFADKSRESKRMLRNSPTTPAPPLGDDVADQWFR